MQTEVQAETATKWQVPAPDRERHFLTGVAAGIAKELGVQPGVVRAGFLLLAAAGGWGLILYVVAWAVMTARPGDGDVRTRGATQWHAHAAIGLIVLGLVMGIRVIGLAFIDGVVWPLGFVFVGALIAWPRGLDTDGVSTIAKIVAGVTVGIGGLLAFGALSFSPRDGALALVFTLAMLVGIGVIAAPSIGRMVTALDSERRERVRADEKARVAAHLHDSVLQTLSLIQRHSDNPTVTSQLARRQERELRNWLFGPEATPGTVRLSTSLHLMASQVEGDHGVPIEVVVVGDAEMQAGEDDNLTALIGATREAVTNAAKHSGADHVDVFAEVRDDHAEVFVRDTGVGFQRTSVETDRRGLSESIEGRMSRVGGQAAIISMPGDGTEVELNVRLSGASVDPTSTVMDIPNQGD